MYALYAVYDAKGNEYRSLFPARSDGIAVRLFSSAVRLPDSELGSYPDDFSLVCLGFFDERSGEISREDARMVISARALVVIDAGVAAVEGVSAQVDLKEAIDHAEV